MEQFSALLALCARNLPVTGELPSQRPVTRSFDVFFDLGLNKKAGEVIWLNGLWTQGVDVWVAFFLHDTDQTVIRD